MGTGLPNRVQGGIELLVVLISGLVRNRGSCLGSSPTLEHIPHTGRLGGGHLHGAALEIFLISRRHRAAVGAIGKLELLGHIAGVDIIAVRQLIPQIVSRVHHLGNHCQGSLILSGPHDFAGTGGIGHTPDGSRAVGDDKGAAIGSCLQGEGILTNGTHTALVLMAAGSPHSIQGAVCFLGVLVTGLEVDDGGRTGGCPSLEDITHPGRHFGGDLNGTALQILLIGRCHCTAVGVVGDLELLGHIAGVNIIAVGQFIPNIAGRIGHLGNHCQGSLIAVYANLSACTGGIGHRPNGRSAVGYNIGTAAGAHLQREGVTANRTYTALIIMVAGLPNRIQGHIIAYADICTGRIGCRACIFGG